MKKGRKIIVGKNLSKQEIRKEDGSKVTPIHVRVHKFEKDALAQIALDHQTTTSDLIRAFILVAKGGASPDDLIYYSDDLVEAIMSKAEDIAEKAK